MKISGVKNYKIIKGWFSDTLPKSNFEKKIAILRLDADWYESTMTCFENLYKNVERGGLIIIDDYYTWDGCAMAVHEFITKQKDNSRLFQSGDGVCYIVKK